MSSKRFQSIWSSSESFISLWWWSNRSKAFRTCNFNSFYLNVLFLLFIREMYTLMFLYCDFSGGTRVLPFTVYFGFAVNLILNSTNFPNQWEPEAWPIIKWWTHAFPCTWQRFQMFQETDLQPRSQRLSSSCPVSRTTGQEEERPWERGWRISSRNI